MFGWNSTAQSAPRRVAEVSGAFDGAAVFAGHGLLSGTKIASNLGWRSVDAIEPGDQVLTFDHGMQVVAEVRRTVLFAEAVSVPAYLLPVTVPAGALGNRTDMRILPEQGVLVETEAAMDMHGDPFAVVPAASLIGFNGVHRVTTNGQIEVITLFFAQPQVIYAEGGALLFCPAAHLQLADMLDPSSQPYDVLTLEEARELVASMHRELVGVAQMGAHVA